MSSGRISAGMELGHDDLGGRHAFFLVDVHRHAAAVVAHRAAAVAVQNHFDFIAVAGERFVDRVVDDFVNHVMKARAVIGVADVHARALAYGIEAFQHLDGLGCVVVRGFWLQWVVGHRTQSLDG